MTGSRRPRLLEADETGTLLSWRGRALFLAVMVVVFLLLWLVLDGPLLPSFIVATCGPSLLVSVAAWLERRD